MNDILDPESTQGPSTRWRIAAGAGFVVLVIIVMALFVRHDAAGQAPEADAAIRNVLRQYGYLVGFALIYIEESGLPLFIPGDAFLLYVGHRLPRNAPVFLFAWLGFVVAVTFGATNLYLLSRRYGRHLLEHRFAAILHLTPERLNQAEQSFRRWGAWALIFGRHIPGLRVPLTVAAGVLKLPYRVFALSVAVSSAAWAGVFLALGAVFGNSIERSIRSSPWIYLIGLIVVVGGLVAIALFRSRRTAASRH
jgi:membrane protein DedA with SNARE-associated domain